jgi:hypothetical protein
VAKVTERGVSFEGSQELFESVFGAQVEIQKQGCHFVTEPRLPKAVHQLESVYFPSAPTFFGNVGRGDRDV